VASAVALKSILLCGRLRRVGRNSAPCARAGLRRLGVAVGVIVAMGLLIPRVGAQAREAPPPLVPVARDQPLELRVLYLEDPRLPTLGVAQRRALAHKVEELLLAWFGYRARLREVGARNLAGFFAAHAAAFRRHAALLAGEIDSSDAASAEKMRAALPRMLAPLSLAEISERFQLGAVATRAEAVTRVAERFNARGREIRAIPVPGGGTLADPAHPELNSYLHWCALMYEQEEADLVFTNTIILGADEQMPLPVVVRGGVTTGNTNANRHNAFGAAAVVGLFPFLSDAPFWQRERGVIPDAERLDVVATMTLHELGHLLLRLGHPADHPQHCVHTPEPALRYYDWHRAIRSGGPCRLPHPVLNGY
jgi:hypothetical protein